MSGQKITELRVVDIKSELQKRGQSQSGKKCELVSRLKHSVNSSFINISNVDILNSSDSSVDTIINTNVRKIKKNNVKSFFTLVNKITEIEKKLKFLEISFTKFRKAVQNRQKGKKQSKIETGTAVSKNMLNINRNDNTSTQGASKILLLSDSQGRNGANIIKSNLHGKVDVCSIIKPNACFEDVVSDINNLATNFTKKDCVIIMAGTNNVLKNQRVDHKVLHGVVNSLKSTNTILVSAPPMHETPNIIGNRASSFNKYLYSYVDENMDISYVDMNNVVSRRDFTKHGLHLNMYGKHTFFKHIANTIKVKVKSDINIKQTNFKHKSNLEDNSELQLRVGQRVVRGSETTYENFL